MTLKYFDSKGPVLDPEAREEACRRHDIVISGIIEHIVAEQRKAASASELSKLAKVARACNHGDFAHAREIAGLPQRRPKDWPRDDPTDPDKPRRVMERFNEMLDLPLLMRKLDTMTDEEVADLIIEHIWSKYDILSSEGEVLSSAIDRLKRAKGGPHHRE